MRDPWLDNIKFVLVTVVVVGHTLPLVPTGTDFGAQLYDFIYVWHIPAFVLVTGYLSRSFTWSRRHLTSLATGLLLPYLVFDSVMRVVITHTADYSPPGPMLINPGWPMWYLVATLLWRLVTPILQLHWVAVPLSVLASLWFGTIDAPWTDWFDLSRTVGFLPFFVVGLWLRPVDLDRLRAPRTAWFGVAALAVVWWLAGGFDDWMATRWLWYAIPYPDLTAAGMPVTDLEGAWIRLRLIALGLVASFAVICLVPRGRHWFSALGTASLVVYLFHGFVIRAVGMTDLATWAHGQGNWLTGMAVLCAVGVAIVLAAPPVASRLAWLIDPISEQRRRSARRAAERSAPTSA
ncbi:acyltransferase family protein [Nocardioides sp. Bht2]|uniref:acyltransferase family protein n=1 Tax=Nocardioides sp. Bht2 TaxID=3392297 RepID=UPI0039B4900A